MAGKTSLARSLQAKAILHTYRVDNPQSDAAYSNRPDETTKFFNFVDVVLRSSDPNLRKHQNVNVIDFGADEIYQQAYQLLLTKDCIPVIVVNITEYMRKSQEWGRREATRRVVFDWIAHLYLACPLLEKPILVLTHKDRLGSKFPKIKRELLCTVSELREELLQTYGNLDTIEALQSGIFLEGEVFEITGCKDASYPAVFGRLEDVLNQRATASEVTVPASWKVIMDKIKSMQQSHINLRELFAGHSTDSVERMKVILHFMKRSGEILWYPDSTEKGLADIIFHDPSRVTNILIKLFEHKSELDLEELEQILQITASADDLPIPTNIAMKLMAHFNLIYATSTTNNAPGHYLIPYFMRRHQFSPITADINLEGELVFLGLSVPAYGYQKMTVSFLNLIVQPGFEVAAFRNGASGRCVENTSASVPPAIAAQLIHESELQKVIIKVNGAVSQVGRCWKMFLDIISELTATVKTSFPASNIRYEFVCAHCLLFEESNPEKRSNPEFITQAISGRSFKFGEYREDCICRNVTAIPSPLRYPCGELQEEVMMSLVQYIRCIQPDEQQEIIRLVEEQYDGLYSTTALHPTLYLEKVYKMTRTRGRALIINNRHGDITADGKGRRGSDRDYTNMKNMWERFGFIISHFSRDGDWTSHEIVEAVHNETELVYKSTPVQYTSVHEGLGMFVLVMMSHGDTGTIVGCDGKHVNLVDIYKLLASQYFTAMRGKPKLIILNACSGERVVRRRRASPIGIPVETNADDSYETIDDLLVMKPGFDEYVSYRNCVGGSSFIRVLVAAFYRYAGEKDLRTLADLIQRVAHYKARGYSIDQGPVTISTFTNGRKLYLYPGVNMRTTDHPESFTSRELPPPDRQRITLNWRADDEASDKYNPSIKKKTVRFEIVRNI